MTTFSINTLEGQSSATEPNDQKENSSWFAGRKVTKIIDVITWMPRFVFAAIRFVAMAILFLLGCIFYRSDYLEPKVIENNKTPILLIHGSSSNRRQWDFVRNYFESNQTGHVFSLNLNSNPLVNDEMTIDQYAQERVAAKVEELKKRYLAAGFELDQIILIGHSMGGLVGASYALKEAQRVGVKVNSLITISSPWEGALAADLVYEVDQIPHGFFVRNNKTRVILKNQMMEKVVSGELRVHTFSSTFDPLVPPESSRLDLDPNCQIFSKTHDHWSTMGDPMLAREISNKWIVPYTQALNSI